MIHFILATVPARKNFVERLLREISTQTVLPDVLHLCLDGYSDAPAPALPEVLINATHEHRTLQLSGPGARWRILAEVPTDATVVVLDDDQILQERNVVEALVIGVAPGRACGYQGIGLDGAGVFLRGQELITCGAAAMAAHASDLTGLQETAADVQERCGFDPFSDGGDDEAVVALHLWRRGTKIFSTGRLAIGTVSAAQVNSQTERRVAGGQHIFWQREAIARATGWPWPRR